MPITILPSIDLRRGQVVRLKQGDYGQQITYNVDPLDTARSFTAAGATWMHIVDLDGAKEGRPMQTDLIRAIISASGLKVQVGGGIRQRQHIDELLAAGASRVVVGTRALEDWAWFEQQTRDPALVGRMVLALDAKDGVVATRGWTQSTGQLATDIARQVSAWPLAAILYTDVARDGLLQGPNFEQTRHMAEAGQVPVIASGGVGSLDHIRQLTRLSILGAIVGRSLYEGKVNLLDAIFVAAAPAT
jgi:phosphoribosylformimino-5-aminoimidazole carboxamide ribotide isomerase